MLLHVTQDKVDHREETLKFFDWAFTNGNQAVEDLDYIPLPESAVTEICPEWRAKVKDTSGRPVAGP